jgi:hypothetical protein
LEGRTTSRARGGISTKPDVGFHTAYLRLQIPQPNLSVGNRLIRKIICYGHDPQEQLDVGLADGESQHFSSIGPNATAIDPTCYRYMLTAGDDMTIKAVLRHGIIQPIDPLPSDWADGQELVVEEPQPNGAGDLAQWAQEMDAATAEIPAEEHERFLNALDEIERDSKEAVRRQWGLP